MSLSKKMSSPEKCVIFLHIPKASGTTLRTIIDRQFHEGAILTIGGRSENEFKNVHKEEKARIRCLRGHIWFGVHEYLPQPSTYFTILRDPVDRIISYYYYVLQNPYHYLFDEVTSKNISLKDFVDSGISWEQSNGQTCLISGIEETISGTSYGNYGHLSPDVLEIAKKNLQDYFTVVGLSERFDESLLLLKRTFGWKNIRYKKQNVNRKRLRKADIPNDTLRLIERYNELDIELYNFAKQLFERQIYQQGSSFQKDLRIFKSKNKLYQEYLRLTSSTVNLLPHGIRRRRRRIYIMIRSIGKKCC